MRIFLSTQSIDSSPAADLFSALRATDCIVEHSPRNPSDGYDERWPDWYEKGLTQTLKSVDRFIIVVDKGWDSSTWMGIEAEAAIAQDLSLEFWNPQDCEIAPGMITYLRRRLPNELTYLVTTLQDKESEWQVQNSEKSIAHRAGHNHQKIRKVFRSIRRLITLSSPFE
ncbi:MAG: hypothetical protein AAFN40_18515 [Cyanobacteria bacterium J06560_6]